MSILMSPPLRKIAFLTASTDHGMFIVNRFDAHAVASNRAYGVGFELLENSSRATGEISLGSQLLDLRRQHFGDGVVVIDCGANIGIHTVEWARHMTGWGSVLAIEPQERIYYALGGNIAINNCFNARAICAAVGRQPGTMKMPEVDYLAPGSFGSLELKKLERTEFIGQKIDYGKNLIDIRTVSLDSLSLPRADLIKIDVEGMEMDALEGGSKCLAMQRPLLFIEWIKNDKDKLQAWLKSQHYAVKESGMNLVAVHESDPCLKEVMG
jgi:FkbM family methyltransferase